MSHIAPSTKSPPTLFHQPRPFKSPDQSKHCWDTRNSFYACLDSSRIDHPPEYVPERGHVVAMHHGDKTVCQEGREEFEKSCARDWVGYFNRRRILECRLRDFHEHSAADAVAKGTEIAAKKTLGEHLAEGGQ